MVSSRKTGLVSGFPWLAESSRHASNSQWYHLKAQRVSSRPVSWNIGDAHLDLTVLFGFGFVAPLTGRAGDRKGRVDDQGAPKPHRMSDSDPSEC